MRFILRAFRIYGVRQLKKVEIKINIHKEDNMRTDMVC